MRLVVRRISKQHDRENFDCGKEPLTQWFRKSARQSDTKGHTRTWVIVDEEESFEKGQRLTVFGYFSICPSQVAFESVPEDLKRHFPEYPVPAFLIARLARDKRYGGQGLGSFLLIEAFRKVVEAHEVTAGPIIEVDAIDEEAKAFYEHVGFKPSLSEMEPMKRFLSVQKAEAAVKASDAMRNALPPSE